MKTKIEIKQEEYPEIDFSKIINIPSVEALGDTLIIKLEIKE